MKTSFRIFTMSLVALVAFTFASKTFAAVDAFIIFTDKDGITTKVPVDQDGNFTTPAMKAGTYTYSWTLASKPTGSNAKLFGVGRGIGSPMGGSTDREASAPSVSEVVVSKVEVSFEIKAPRDVATGQASGKRMHKPFMITKELDKSTPLLATSIGTVEINAAGDSITGTVSFKSSNGSPVKASWDLKQNTK